MGIQVDNLLAQWPEARLSDARCQTHSLWKKVGKCLPVSSSLLRYSGGLKDFETNSADPESLICTATTASELHADFLLPAYTLLTSAVYLASLAMHLRASEPAPERSCC